MDPQYVAKVQAWVECDNAIQKHKSSMKPMQDKKKELEDDIVKYVEDHKYDKLVINISDGQIKFGKRNVTQPLSMKTLRGILDDYATKHDSINVNDIMEFVSGALEVKSRTIMSREIKE